MRRRMLAITVILVSAMTVACEGTRGEAAGEALETAKSEVCQRAPEWQATLEEISQADGEVTATLQSEVDELAAGVDDATQALSDAGADRIADAAATLGDTIDEIAAALGSSTAEAAQRATQALTNLEALATLVDCGS